MKHASYQKSLTPTYVLYRDWTLTPHARNNITCTQHYIATHNKKTKQTLTTYILLVL